MTEQLRRLIFEPLRYDARATTTAWKLPEDVIERMASGYFLESCLQRVPA